MSTNQKIERAREIRLWIKDLIIPAVVGAGTIMALNPELKDRAKDKITDVKNKFKKGE